MISMHVKLRWGQFDANMCACHVVELLTEEENKWGEELVKLSLGISDTVGY